MEDHGVSRDKVSDAIKVIQDGARRFVTIKEKSKKLPKKPKETELKSDGGLVLLTKETTEKVVQEAEAKAAAEAVDVHYQCISRTIFE